MIWEEIVQRYNQSPAEGGHLPWHAAALWPQASEEDLAWLAQSLHNLSDLDFLSRLFHHVESAPVSLLEPLIEAAVRVPRGVPQLGRIFTEYAERFYGAHRADGALLRHVETGPAAAARRAIEILEWWGKPTPEMKERRQIVYARRFLAETDAVVERRLAHLLRFDEDPYPEGERRVVRRALEKARAHPDRMIRAIADEQLRFAAHLRAMPSWLRPAWHAYGEGKRERVDPLLNEPSFGDPRSMIWLADALSYESERLHYFAVGVIARTAATSEPPACLRRALVEAAVRELDPSWDRAFVEPAAALFGPDAIANDLLDELVPGEPEVRIVGAARALYWIRGTLEPATRRRSADSHVMCFVAGSEDLQQALAGRFSLDVGQYPVEMKPLLEKARGLGLAHPDESIRAWARRPGPPADDAG